MVEGMVGRPSRRSEALPEPDAMMDDTDEELSVQEDDEEEKSEREESAFFDWVRAAVGAVLAVVLVGIYSPARRISSIPPTEALRDE